MREKIKRVNFMSCTLSKFCRIHSKSRRSVNEVGYEREGINKASIINNKHKSLMCKLVNDQGIYSICKKHSLIVSEIKEIEYDPSLRCIGINENGNTISIVMKTLAYSELIAIVIHELVHHSVKPHDDKFKALENQYRKEYTQFTGMLDNFPISNGATIRLSNRMGGNRSVSRSNRNDISLMIIIMIVFLCMFIHKFFISESNK
jgi:hypothetical protein